MKAEINDIQDGPLVSAFDEQEMKAEKGQRGPRGLTGERGEPGKQGEPGTQGQPGPGLEGHAATHFLGGNDAVLVEKLQTLEKEKGLFLTANGDGSLAFKKIKMPKDGKQGKDGKPGKDGVSLIGGGGAPTPGITYLSGITINTDKDWEGFDITNVGLLSAANVTITSITQGSVLFAGAGGAVSQDNSNFFWDDTNDFLGLGTATPSDELHVLGDNPVAVIENNDTSGTASLLLKGDTSSGGSALGIIQGEWDDNLIANIQFLAGADIGNKDDGSIQFNVSDAGSIPDLAMHIQSNRAVDINSLLRRINDTNTYLQFTSDQIDLVAGGLNFIRMDEATTDILSFNINKTNIDIRLYDDVGLNTTWDAGTSAMTVYKTLIYDPVEITATGTTTEDNHLIYLDGTFDYNFQKGDPGREFITKNKGTGIITLKPQAGQFIEDTDQYTLFPNESAHFHYKKGEDAYFATAINRQQIYGEIYVEGNTTETVITASGQANKVQVTVFTRDGHSVTGLTPDHTNDHITVVSPGDYLATVSLHIDSVAGAGAEFGFSLYKNNGDTDFDNVHSHRDMPAGGGQAGSASMSGIIRLAENDTVELWAWNETNTTNIIVADCTFSLVQLLRGEP